MAFAKLQKLSEEKIRIVLNQLLRGVPSKTLARTIQNDWGEAQDVSAATLTRELERLHLSAAARVFGDNSPEQLQAQARDRVFEGPYNQLEELLTIQSPRIEKFLKTETQQNKFLPALSGAIKDYINTLVQMQKMRFDLGLDEYKRVILTRRERDAAIAEAQEAAERENYRRIVETAQFMDEVFQKRRITLPPKATKPATGTEGK